MNDRGGWLINRKIHSQPRLTEDPARSSADRLANPTSASSDQLNKPRRMTRATTRAIDLVSLCALLGWSGEI